MLKTKKRLIPVALSALLCGLSFLCKGDDVLNALNHKRSYFSPLIKGTAICVLAIVWNMGFLVNFNPCQAIPFSFEPEFLDKPQMRHKVVNSSVVFSESFVIKKQPTIVISLQKSIQFSRKSIKKLFSVFSGFIFSVESEQKQASKQRGRNSQQAIDVVFYVIKKLNHFGETYVLPYIPIIVLLPYWIYILTQRRVE